MCASTPTSVPLRSYLWPAGGIWAMLGKRRLLCFPTPCTPSSSVPCFGQQQGHGRRAAGWQRPGEDTWRIKHQIKGTSAGDIRQKAFNASPWSRQIYSRDSFPFPITKKLRQLDIQETLFNTFLFI